MNKWSEKIVLVTGGSSGLGFEIARQFGRRGAVAVILGRDQARLKAALSRLGSEQIKCDSVVADVTKEEQVAAAIETVVAKRGRLDVLVNNVGRSVRTALLSVTVDDFRQLMETNFFSAVSFSRAALPALEKTDGHIVNIGSLAAKTAWPYLAPYSASKFALASYTHQLRLEGPKNVHYMLVCSGPIKRDDANRRYDDEADAAKLPEVAKLPGAGAKVEGISPELLAKRIITGCEKRSREVIFPFRARFLFTLLAYYPPLGDWLLRRMMKD